MLWHYSCTEEFCPHFVRKNGFGVPKTIGITALFRFCGLFPLIKPRKAKSLAVSRILAFSISVVPHNVPQILGVFEVPKNQ